MEITFDPAKDASNRHKHGVSLADAARIDPDSLRYWVDERIDHSETRYRGQGLIGDRLYSVAFRIRDGVMRVISLRKANAREVRDYAQHD
jgi:uncharacterized DUF497 family protein